MPTLDPELRKLLFGNPFGEVFPPKPNPPPLAVDGRTTALRILGRYIGEIEFYRPMKPGDPPSPFHVKTENFHPDWPDHEQDLIFPSCVVIPGTANYAVIGLTAYVEESTRDKYQLGTVLQWMSEYTENLFLEFWCTKNAERRSIAAAFESAMSPTEQMSGLRFRMPDYFDELVCFTLNTRQNIDDEQAGRGRRRVRFGIEMRFNIVALVNTTPFIPEVRVDTDVDEDTQIAFELGGPDDPNAEIIPDDR